MKRRILISILAAVTAVSVLSGCQAPKVNEGTKKDEIILAVTQSLDNLDPHKAEGAGTKEILFNIYEGLVKYNSKGELKDTVAEEHTISDDAKVYTFKIRKGIKFHNGKELTCGDVKYSLERASGLASGTPLVEGLSVIEKIDIDDANVIITLKNPDSEFIAYLTTAIIPENISDSELEKTPVGTGPFKFVEYAPQQKFVVEKNNDYYGNKAKINKVTFKIVADMDSAFLELKAGNIDIFPYLTNDKTEQLGDNYQILDGNMNMVQLLGLNNSRKPYDDVRVRKAMNLAIDTKEIIDLVAYGYGTQIGGGMMPAYKKYYVEGLSDKYNKNIEEAKKLLKEAGYENGFETTITVPSNYIFHVQTAQVIVNQLKEIGVKATIKQVEWGVWLEQV